jgi:hypothetical protein
MKIGIAGGLIIGGLGACALVGAWGLILVVLGVMTAACELQEEKLKEKRQFQSQIKYPPYGY